jgi:hypothetical protein
MPTFKISGQPANIWIPRERMIAMESAAGGLTTAVRFLALTPKGEGLATIEVEGRCEILGAAIDAGTPTEVGQ